MRTSSVLSVLVSLVALTAAASAQPVTQSAYLKPPVIDGFSFEELFAESVDVSGDTVVVGAGQEDSQAAGVDGDPSGNLAAFSGAAFVFVRDGGGWSQQAYLKAAHPDAADRFGTSVAIDGDTIAVGAIREASSSAGVNGDPTDDSLIGSGAVYVFVRDGTTWTQQAYLKASNPDGVVSLIGDEFGTALALDGDTLVVGVPHERSDATGVNGDQEDNSLNGAGAAYVFVRDGTTWSQQAYLKASNTNANDAFGSSVAVSGDTIAVGAPGEDSGSTGVGGAQGGGVESAGAVYIFKRTGSTWIQQAYVKASNTTSLDYFGGSVALDGDRLAVGAPFEDGESTGVNGTQGDHYPNSGAAYLFERSGGSWAQTDYVKASNTGSGDRFGISIDLDGDVLVVGAGEERSMSAGVDGDDADDSLLEAGAGFVFVREDGVWSQQAYLKATLPRSGDQLGGSASDNEGETARVSDGLVVLGAPREDGASPGIDGPQGPAFTLGDVGAAFVFDVSGLTYDGWSDEGCALAGAAGFPALSGDGPLYDGSFNEVSLSNAAPSAFSGLFIGTTSTPTLFKGGTLKPVPWTKLAFVNTSASGTLSLPFVMPAGLPSGFELWLQVAITDAGAPIGVALSNALRGTTP